MTKMPKNNRKDPSSFIEPSRTKSSEVDYRIELNSYIANSIGTNVEKMQNFSKYVPTQEIRKFIVRYELFKKILNIHGSIIECGVLHGGGLMSWAHLSEIFEPINHTRKIYGFDGFAGFFKLSNQDKSSKNAVNAKSGGLKVNSYDDINESISIFDKSRVINHIPKIKLVKGNIEKTLPIFIKENPFLVVSLLWLDFDIYEPTKVALELLFDRIPKGGIIAFDELNHELWPGETIALHEFIGIKNLKIERFAFGGTTSYAIIK